MGKRKRYTQRPPRAIMIVGGSMSGHKRNGWKMRSENKKEDETNAALDDLAEFEQYRASVLDAIRKDLAAGMTSDQLLKKYESQAMARVITVALTEADSSKALAAAKDVIDRSKGKAAENKTVKHKFEDVDDAQLDALIAAKILEEEEETDGTVDKEMQ
jgi:capsular polysaccharide biosynthesis protein